MNPLVGDVIYDHYKPESMEDAVPRTLEGAVLSIADKADSIAGMFALGMQPTGSKDPFALRRAGNGIVRILAEHKLPLSLAQITADALLQYRHRSCRCAVAGQGQEVHGGGRVFGTMSRRSSASAWSSTCAT